MTWLVVTTLVVYLKSHSGIFLAVLAPSSGTIYFFYCDMRLVIRLITLYIPTLINDNPLSGCKTTTMPMQCIVYHINRWTINIKYVCLASVTEVLILNHLYQEQLHFYTRQESVWVLIQILDICRALEVNDSPAWSWCPQPWATWNKRTSIWTSNPKCPFLCLFFIDSNLVSPSVN